MLAFVGRRYRQILVGSAVAGVLEVLWYVISVWTGHSLAQASDFYQPSAALWCLAATAGLFSLSWWWDQRTRNPARTHPERWLPTSAYMAGLTGGVFFAHTIFINLIRSILDATGLRASLPWEATVAILFVGTVTLTGAFIAVVLRTPLRWVLGGPLRSAQRCLVQRTEFDEWSSASRPSRYSLSGVIRTERRSRMGMAVVVGNPKAGSRTLRVALAVANDLSVQLGFEGEKLVVDLADVAAELFDPESLRVKELLGDVATSNLIIVASPTFKATYTGLLKTFFDRYSTDALRGAVAVGVMTGAAPIHALAVEVHLRPLLVELGASVPTRGLYITEQQFDNLGPAIGGWVEVATPLLARALA